MKRFLCTLLSLSVGAFAVDFSGDFKGPAGLQLYSLRESFKTDVPGTLDKVKALGIREVETASTYGLGPEKFKAMLEERGLKPVSGHFQYEALKKDTAAAVKEAQALGLKFAVCPWIPHEIGSFGEADVQRAAADFKTFGAAFKAAGIQVAYHPHGYEFRPVVEGGTETLFDRMVKTTDANVVSFEMDVFWVVHPGQDPAKLLATYPDRWVLMHLKDIRKGARTGVFTGKAPLTDDVPLGTGQVDWPTVLKAAAKAGVKHYFIEDESPTVADALPVTLKYLQTVKF
ncbi:MAG TPA: sugar phosphate isomerase/epimerase [Chthoniobacteraceae bacterium]|nr:sugar phosphate isomerase/epimerase [Chthoniobacteraceae bacterium]